MVIEKTVLLIDDDDDDLEMLRWALNAIDAEHTIIEAHDGVEGLKTLNILLEQERLPCLIVLDINMHKMDGKQTFTAIKANGSFANIPIVIFSTSASPVEKTFFERNRTAYMVKPFSLPELSQTASRMINICDDKSNRTDT